MIPLIQNQFFAKSVYSFDDWVGYGFHGDFIMGWKQGAIEGLLDYCQNHADGASKVGLL